MPPTSSGGLPCLDGSKRWLTMRLSLVGKWLFKSREAHGRGWGQPCRSQFRGCEGGSATSWSSKTRKSSQTPQPSQLPKPPHVHTQSTQHTGWVNGKWHNTYNALIKDTDENITYYCVLWDIYYSTTWFLTLLVCLLLDTERNIVHLLSNSFIHFFKFLDVNLPGVPDTIFWGALLRHMAHSLQKCT